MPSQLNNLSVNMSKYVNNVNRRGNCYHGDIGESVNLLYVGRNVCLRVSVFVRVSACVRT